jgi:AcrR family transcriptional regulator
LVNRTSKRGAGRPAGAEAADREGQIVSSAISLFAEHGYASTTIQQIAAHAGVAASLVTHYFGSKEQLIRRCNSDVLSQMRDDYNRIHSNLTYRSGHEFVDRVTERTIQTFTGRTEIFRYLRHMFLEATPETSEFFREYYDILRQHVDRIEAAGELQPGTNKVWVTFQIIFMQLGPAFLMDQIGAVIGRDTYDLAVSRARVEALANTLKFGIFAPPAPEDPIA